MEAGNITIIVEDYEAPDQSVVFSELIPMSNQEPTGKMGMTGPKQQAPGNTLQQGLRELETETRNLSGFVKQRGESLNKMEASTDAADGALNDIVNIIGQMENEMHLCNDQFLQLETREKELLAERDLLSKKIKEECSTRRTINAIPEIILDTDNINTARIMRDEARETLYMKNDELELANDRNKQVNHQILSEWKSIHEQLSSMFKEREGILKNLNDFDDLRISRLRNELKDFPEGADRDGVDTAIEWLSLCQDERNLQNQLDQLELDLYDEVNRTTLALGVKKREINRLDEISREYHETKVRAGEDTGFYVRETKSSSNLPLSTEPMISSESLSDLDLAAEESVDNSTQLHHCSRDIDLAQTFDDDEYLRFQSSVMERNMQEYMESLRQSDDNVQNDQKTSSSEDNDDVEGTMYSDNEDNIKDAVMEFPEPQKGAKQKEAAPVKHENPLQMKLAKEKTTTASSRKLPSHTESSNLNQETLTSKIRGRLGLNFDRTRGGSNTEITKGAGVRATGSGTFAKGKKK